jgi:hypothetical protein
MPHQKSELSGPSLGSRIVSAFRGSGNDARLAALERRVLKLMVDFTRLDEALSGAVADINELKALRPKVAALEAEVAALKADAEMLQGNVDFRAAKIEDARGGSTGGIS